MTQMMISPKLIVSLFAFLLTSCTTVGLRDTQALATMDFGPRMTLRVCALMETGIFERDVAMLLSDAGRELADDFGILVELRNARPWVRNGFTVYGLAEQLLKEPLPPHCDRLFAFVSRNMGDVVWGMTGLPEVLGWVNDETGTHGYAVVGWATINQLFMPPTAVLRHELLHMLGCEHAVTMAGCYQRIAALKLARVGEFMPAWDAERGRMLRTRAVVRERLGK